ncbi:MAG: SDR family NAD(P)-dependent oxidoreductase [Myxococcota bacterium]|nr:SDR family NAD(P)-dependent oxidoreductase [Myxococcota bacterium]
MTAQAPVVVLTGASSGIGAALAVELARQQEARITLLARRLELLEEVAARVEEAGGQPLCIPCDVSDAEAVQEAVDRTVDRFGPIDLAIANAGIGEPMPVRKAQAAGIAKVMRVNFEGSTNLFAAVLPSMLASGGGQLVGVSSIAAFRGLPGSANYSASKAALTSWLESARVELKHHGIAVSTVHPGFVETPMTQKNPFPMPFMVPVDRSARVIVRGIRRRKAEINFPWPMVTVLRILRSMPNWLYDFTARLASPFGKKG